LKKIEFEFFEKDIIKKVFEDIFKKDSFLIKIFISENLKKKFCSFEGRVFSVSMKREKYICYRVSV